MIFRIGFACFYDLALSGSGFYEPRALLEIRDREETK